MISTVRPLRHVHTFTYTFSFWYDHKSQTTSTCTYFHLHPQRLIWPQQSDHLDMYILSPTPSAFDMTSTVRTPRHVHTFTYTLSVWYDLNSQTTSTCTYFHLHPQRLIWPQQSDLLSHTRHHQHLAEMYPSNDININELWPVKHSVANRGIRYRGAQPLHPLQTQVLHSNVMMI